MDEKGLRIRLAVWALAYERYNHSFVPDDVYDQMSLKVDLSTPTDRPDLDEWYSNNFNVSTGQWVHTHPEIDRLHMLVRQLIRYKP